MKKVITTILFFTIFAMSIFASTGNIILNGSVTGTPYNLKLLYGTNPTEISTNYTIDTTFNLKQNGNTEHFYIVVNGNESVSKNCTITVTPNPFLPTSSGTYKQDDNVVVNYNEVSKTTVISSGVHENGILNEFYLDWTGKTDLTAGDYQSTIQISYTIN